MNRMLLSLLLALCAAPLQAITPMEEFRRIYIRQSNCLEKEHLTMQDVHAYAVRGKLENAANKPELKCFAACLFQHSGMMADCFVRDEYYAHIKIYDDLYDILVKCKGRVVSDDRCECAQQLSECMVEQIRLKFGDD